LSLLVSLSLKIPDFDGRSLEVSGGREGLVVKGLTFLTPAVKEALVEVEGELAVVDADAQRGVGAEDKEVVLASPFPNLKMQK
jgi:hypothetical protein